LYISKSIMKKVWANKKIRIICWALVIWIAGHVTYITIDGLTEYDGSADVAVILGNRVYADGTLSSWLKGRADAALKLYREKRVKKIFASGRVSPEEDGGYPEGTAIKAYLIGNGVASEDVIADNEGINTYRTAENYNRWSKLNNYNSVIVVSQFFHVTRTKYIFRKLGIQNVHDVSSHVYGWRDIPGTLREVPAFYKYVLVY